MHMQIHLYIYLNINMYILNIICISNVNDRIRQMLLQLLLLFTCNDLSPPTQTIKMRLVNKFVCMRTYVCMYVDSASSKFMKLICAGNHRRRRGRSYDDHSTALATHQMKARTTTEIKAAAALAVAELKDISHMGERLWLGI